MSQWAAELPLSHKGEEPVAWAGLLISEMMEASAKSPGKLKSDSAGRCYRSSLKYVVILSAPKEGQMELVGLH